MKLILIYSKRTDAYAFLAPMSRQLAVITDRNMNSPGTWIGVSLSVQMIRSIVLHGPDAGIFHSSEVELKRHNEASTFY